MKEEVIAYLKVIIHQANNSCESALGHDLPKTAYNPQKDEQILLPKSLWTKCKP